MTTIFFVGATTLGLVFLALIIFDSRAYAKIPRTSYARVFPGFRNLARAAATVTALPVTGDRRRHRDYKTHHMPAIFNPRLYTIADRRAYIFFPTDFFSSAFSRPLDIFAFVNISKTSFSF